MILVWDEWNVDHIAKHAVEPIEAAQVVDRASRPFPRKAGPRKFQVRGQTASGRYLQVVYVIREPDTIDVASLDLEDRTAIEAGEQVGYVIHARGLEPGEIRTLRKRSV